jgi:hypothetical protein
MILRVRFALVVLCLAVPAVFAAVPALAYSVLNSGPATGELTFQGDPTPPDVAGGTFPALEDTLGSFTLNVGVAVGGVQDNSLRAIVLETDPAGTPTGTPIWESAPFQAIGDNSWYYFEPAVPLPVVVGEQYFIGIDSGVYTDAWGDFTIEISTPGIAGGQFWLIDNGQPLLGIPGIGVTTGIQFGHAPEPGTILMVGLGLGLLAYTRRS